jgi:hypothetical protein
MKYFWNENFNLMDVSTRLIIEAHLDRFHLQPTPQNLQAVMEFLSSIEENDFNRATGHKITMVAGEYECEVCGQSSLNGELEEKCPKSAVI